MADQNDDVQRTCAELRQILLDTKNCDRREFLRILRNTAAGSALVTTFIGDALRPIAAAERPVTIFSYGGSYKKAMLEAFCDPFTKKTGIPVQYQEPYSFAKLRAMHEAKAQQIDAVLAATNDTLLVNEFKMATPLDWNIIDRNALTPNQLSFPNLIGFVTQANPLCYNKKKWPGAERPNSWPDFWNVEKFPGRRSLRRTHPLQMIEAALLADGVKESEFYPVDIDRAFRKLDQIKPHIKVWWSDNSQAQQLMEQEEVDIIYMTNGRASQSIIESNLPFGIIWNQAIGDDGRFQGWYVPTGCPNVQGGMKFLDMVGRAETQAVFARIMYYSPQNQRAYDLLSPEIKKELPMSPENAKVAHILNYEWWSKDKNYVNGQRRFESWLQS